MLDNNKYDYFDSATRLYRSDGKKTEFYAGNGVWKESNFNPNKAMDFMGDSWDFGNTTKITSNIELENIIEIIDEDAKGK